MLLSWRKSSYLSIVPVARHVSSRFPREFAVSLTRSPAVRTILPAGGGSILSTGDQCGRDTPDENIPAMVDVAGDYGRY